MTAFFVKGKFISQQAAASSQLVSRVILAVMSRASSVMEIAVGLSLVVIGIIGMKEAREWIAEDDDEDIDENDEGDFQHKSLSAAAVNVPTTTSKQSSGSGGSAVVAGQTRAVLLNGLPHGFSWDGAPSLAPALAVATWKGNVAFLLAYALGTIGDMTVATTVIGEGTQRAGKFFNDRIFHRNYRTFRVFWHLSLDLCGVEWLW